MSELDPSLREAILSFFGLFAEKPKVPKAPKTPRRPKPSATFSTGTAPVPVSPSTQREPSAIPGRKAILVGTSVRLADQRRAGPGARLPGESDRDFVLRRRRISSAHARGLAPPDDDRIRSSNSTKEYWEMGH